jgi:histidinol-phosphate aminotransferase
MTNNSIFFKQAKPGINQIKPYKPGKPAHEVAQEYGLTSIIKLASNENPFGSSPKALAAIANNTSTLFRYPDGKGAALKQAISETIAQPIENITLGNGSDDVIEMLAHAFVSENDHVVFSKHAFEVYKLVSMALGADISEIPALPQDHETNGLGHDLDAFLRAITEKTKLVFIANPNNPTGGVIQPDTLFAFLKQVPAQTVVLVDEAYFEYVDQPGYHSAIKWINEFPNLVVTRTFSKLYGLPGLRIGYGVSSPAISDILNRIRQPFNVNSLAQISGVAALSDAEFIEYSTNQNARGRAWLTDQLNQRGLQPLPSQANFLCFTTPYLGKQVFEQLLKKGMIIRDLDSYELLYHLRVTIGSETENQTFIRLLDQVLEDLKSL